VLEKVTARSFLEKLVEQAFISNTNLIVLQCLLLEIERPDLFTQIVHSCQKMREIVYLTHGKY